MTSLFDLIGTLETTVAVLKGLTAKRSCEPFCEGCDICTARILIAELGELIKE